MARTRTHPIGLLTLIFAFAAILPTQALADLSNGSFEGAGMGSLTGWPTANNGGTGGTKGSSVTTVGTFTSAGTSPRSWPAQDGSWFALLKASTSGNNKTIQLYQSFVVGTSGDTLSFDYFWDSEAGPQSARGLILSGAGTLLPSGLLSGTQVGSDLFSFTSSTPNGAWTSFSSDATSLGLGVGSTYTLLFEITGKNKAAYASHLGVDDVHLVSPPPDPDPVPAPASILLGMLGVTTAGLKLRKLV